MSASLVHTSEARMMMEFGERETFHHKCTEAIEIKTKKEISSP